jgi:hypothetical protein
MLACAESCRRVDGIEVGTFIQCTGCTAGGFGSLWTPREMPVDSQHGTSHGDGARLPWPGIILPGEWHCRNLPKHSKRDWLQTDWICVVNVIHRELCQYML